MEPLAQQHSVTCQKTESSAALQWQLQTSRSQQFTNTNPHKG